MNELDREWLKDMLESAKEAVALLGERSVAELDADRRTLLAVSLALQTVGEAASRVSLQGRSVVTGVAWEKIVGMRHRLVHGYRTRSTAIVFATVKEHLPPLILALEAAGVEDTP